MRYNKLMKKAIALALLLLAITAGWLVYSKSASKRNSLQRKSLPDITSEPTVKNFQEKRFIFVPYWSLQGQIDPSYDSILYFGVGVDREGLDDGDVGYKKLAEFKEMVSDGKETILTVKMTDSSVNSDVLKSNVWQEKIIRDAVSLAKEYEFDGVLLDFETSAMGFEKTIANISSFYTKFSKNVKENSLLFYVTVFGDTYYRSRAYDIKTLGSLSDKVIVMTYDFHKARGNPGPNFPLSGKSQYGYDIAEMIDDFSKDVPNEKIVIALGFFGYDWEVDKSGNTIVRGDALSLNQINNRYVFKCEGEMCKAFRRAQTAEPFVEYSKDGRGHVVWFEDQTSIAKKEEYLSTRGINQIAIWAYSYF